MLLKPLELPAYSACLMPLIRNQEPMMSRRPHLTLVRQAVADDDYAYDPPFWLGVVVMLVLGVLLAPVAYGAEPLTVSLEALWERPTVEPDRSAYRRALAEAATVNDVATWLVYGDTTTWWGHVHEACTAAVWWLALRERVTGVRLT